MNLKEALNKHEGFLKKRLYTVIGNIIPLDDGRVKIKCDSYAYAVVNEEDIDPLLIFPLTDEDPIFPLTNDEKLSGRESKYAIKFFEGTKVELHVKNIVHEFTMAESTRPFYIDISNEKIVYLSTNGVTEREGECYKKVYVFNCYCCKGGKRGRCYGWVGCDDGWYDEECC